MTNYQPDTPRAALAVGALFLAGVTFAALVAAPALLDARHDAPALLAAARGHAATPMEVAIVPARIEVIGTRELATARAVVEVVAPDGGSEATDARAPNVAWALPGATAPCRPQG